MVSHRPGQAHGAFHHIKAIHAASLVGIENATPVRKIPGGLQAAGTRGEEISVKRENALGSLEIVERTVTLAGNGFEGQLGIGVADGLILGHDGLRKLFFDFRQELGARR